MAKDGASQWQTKQAQNRRWGIVLRPEALPGFLPQLIVWLIYAALITLLVVHLKKSRRMTSPPPAASSTRLSWRTLIFLSLLFTASSALTEKLLGPHGDIIILSMWLAGGMVGIITLIMAIRAAFRTASGN